MSQDTPRTVLKSVAGWTLGKTLGRGGFGHVRKATHNIARRDCAVKILPSLDFSKSVSKDDMLDAIEAQKEVIMLKVFGGLNMKGIVTLDLVKEKGGWNYLFLPLIPGVSSTLRGPLDTKVLVPFFRGFLCSLQSLHSIGIIHEDLKPANVLLDENGHPVLADFGFATFEPNGNKRTGGGGTMDYLSPEKIVGNPYRGAPSDVWACGILLYHFLTREHPFSGQEKDETDEQIERRIAECPPDLRALDGLKGREKYGDMDAARHLLDAMLHPNPRDRATISEVLAHPFLNPPSIKARDLQQLDTPLLSDKPIRNPKLDLVQHVLFLALLAGQWVMCQTDQEIRENLAADESKPRWEKRMYHALEAWRPKDPDDVGLKDSEISLRSERKPRMKSLERVMSLMELNTIQGPSNPPPAALPNPNKRLSADFPQIKPRFRNEDSVLLDTTKNVNQPKAPSIQVLLDEQNLKRQSNKVTPPVLRTEVTAQHTRKPQSKTRARSPPPIPDENEDPQAEAEELATDENADEVEYLPAPRPPVKVILRRSPRLAGMTPEMSGLPYQPTAKIRRTKPGQ